MTTRTLLKVSAVILRLKGHDVQVAYDGHAALEMASDWRPELVFLDIGMPEMNPVTKWLDGCGDNLEWKTCDWWRRSAGDSRRHRRRSRRGGVR